MTDHPKPAATQQYSGPPSRRQREGREHTAPALATKQLDTTTSSSQSTEQWRDLAQQVTWWEVHLYRDRVLKWSAVRHFPMVGTPAWCDLDDDDPVKLAAVFDAAQHWALRVDTCQEAMAAASRDISAAVDWPTVAKRMQDQREWLAANPWARRVIV
jgi:hypothetical protein